MKKAVVSPRDLKLYDVREGSFCSQQLMLESGRSNGFFSIDQNAIFWNREWFVRENKLLQYDYA